MKFNGIIPALVTPYDAEGCVNGEAIAALVERLVEQGVGGIFACGSTGEWWLLKEEERRHITETVVKAAAGRVPVMAHIGALSTAESVRLAQHAEKAGADAVSALPPIGMPYAADSVWQHFKAIAAGTALPLYLYHLPQVYGDLITIDRFVRAMDEIPTLAGAKFSSYRIDDMIELRLKSEGRLNIISGCGEQLLSAIACGADGSICTWYNVLPRLASKIIECVEQGDVAGARKHEDILVGFGKIGIVKTHGFVKNLLKSRGFDCGRPRAPIPAMSEEEWEAVLPGVEATGVLEWCI